MTDSLSDPTGAVAQRLATLVADYGSRVLDDRTALASLLPDLFADLPRERRIVETAAAAGIAGRLLSQVGQGTPVSVATASVSHIVSEQYSLTSNAADWIVAAYAQALGLSQAGVTPPAAPAASPPGVTVLDAPDPAPVSGWPQPAPQGWPPAQPGYPTQTGYPGYPPQGGYPQQWSAPPAPKPRRAWLIALLVGLPVVALLVGGGAFAAVKLLQKDKDTTDCLVGIWSLKSETVTYTNPASTVTYTGNGTMTVTFTKDGTGSMVTDHVEFDLGSGASYNQTGTITYKWTRTGDKVDYTDAAGQVTTVVKSPGQTDQSSTSDGGPLTSDTVSCSGNSLTATGEGQSTNNDGSKSPYTYRQEFARH